MARLVIFIMVYCSIFGSVVADAQKPEGITLDQLLEMYSREHSVKFIAPTAVTEQVSFYGLDPHKLDWGGLLSAMRLQGYSLVKKDAYYLVTPVSEIRSSPIAVYEAGQDYEQDQFVSKAIHLKNPCANQIVTQIRPMVPRYSHLSTYGEGWTILVTDTYANIVRIEKVVREIDQYATSKEACAKLAGKIKAP